MDHVSNQPLDSPMDKQAGEAPYHSPSQSWSEVHAEEPSAGLDEVFSQSTHRKPSEVIEPIFAEHPGSIPNEEIGPALNQLLDYPIDEQASESADQAPSPGSSEPHSEERIAVQDEGLGQSGYERPSEILGPAPEELPESIPGSTPETDLSEFLEYLRGEQASQGPGQEDGLISEEVLNEVGGEVSSEELAALPSEASSEVHREELGSVLDEVLSQSTYHVPGEALEQIPVESRSPVASGDVDSVLNELLDYLTTERAGEAFREEMASGFDEELGQPIGEIPGSEIPDEVMTQPLGWASSEIRGEEPSAVLNEILGHATDQSFSEGVQEVAAEQSVHGPGGGMDTVLNELLNYLNNQPPSDALSEILRQLPNEKRAEDLVEEMLPERSGILEPVLDERVSGTQFHSVWRDILEQAAEEGPLPLAELHPVTPAIEILRIRGVQAAHDVPSAVWSRVQFLHSMRVRREMPGERAVAGPALRQAARKPPSKLLEQILRDVPSPVWSRFRAQVPSDVPGAAWSDIPVEGQGRISIDIPNVVNRVQGRVPVELRGAFWSGVAGRVAREIPHKRAAGREVEHHAEEVLKEQTDLVRNKVSEQAGNERTDASPAIQTSSLPIQITFPTSCPQCKSTSFKPLEMKNQLPGWIDYLRRIVYIPIKLECLQCGYRWRG